MNQQETFMQKCLELAKQGTGKVSPNPRVGALVVKDGEIISQGWHKEFGKAHAEVNAIKNAGDIDFSECSIFVNLEPCSHKGKTPPCADLIIEKGFKKVYIGMKDPNPLVSGRGIKKLMDAGIEVQTGILEEECKWLNRTFIKSIKEGKPYIVAKTAQSIDSNIALKSGESKWISGEESRKVVHELRAEFDAVMIGRNTALNDNPQLNVRDVDGVDPYRIIIDKDLKLPLELKIFRENVRKSTIVCCTAESLKSKKADLLRLGGVKLLPVHLDGDKFNLNDLLSKLHDEFKIASILVEGGSLLLSSFAEKNLIDEYHVFMAPVLMGQGIHTFDGLNIKKMKDKIPFKLRSVEKCGNDLHIIYLKDNELQQS